MEVKWDSGWFFMLGMSLSLTVILALDLTYLDVWPVSIAGGVVGSLWFLFAMLEDDAPLCERTRAGFGMAMMGLSALPSMVGASSAYASGYGTVSAVAMICVGFVMWLASLRDVAFQ